jgi:protoporphyrinogen oxidase
MIKSDNMNVDVVIIGGGVSGLIAAYDLIHRGWSVMLLEAESELGGLASCIKHADFFIENLYHHLFEHDVEALQLLQELHLIKQVAWQSTYTGLYLQGRWYHTVTPLDLFKLTPLRFLDRIKFGYFLLLSKYTSDIGTLDALSVGDWLHLHAHDTLHPLINQLLHSKFGVGAQDISAAFLCGRFRARSRPRGIFQTRECFGYLHGSLHHVITALSNTIQQGGGHIYLNTRVDRIEPMRQGYQLMVKREGVIHAKAIISTIPPGNFAELAPFLPPFTRERLKRIEYIGVVCTLISLKQSLIPYYWGTIIDQELPFSVLIEHTQLAHSHNYNGEHLVYAARYLPSQKLQTLDIQAWEQDIVAALPKVAYNRNMPCIHWVKTSVFPYATPIYRRGFGQMRDELPAIEGVWMTGATFTYPDSRNINTMIKVARQCTDEITRRLHGDTSICS